jgi:hypothetical protein
MGVFKSIEEFAKYVGKEFLTPPFYITKIITTGKKHPTNYAEVKYEAIIEGEGIIPYKEVQVRYQMVKDKLMSNSIDKKYGDEKLYIDPEDNKSFTTRKLAKAHMLEKGHRGAVIVDLDREWWDTNHLYFNGKDVITYISKKRFMTSRTMQRYDFWVLNISLIDEYPKRFTIKKYTTDLWLNKYTTTLRNFLKESDEPFFYKIPIKKASVFDFMNWKDSPLK